jgi:predicted glycosyltransferase
MAPGRVVRVVNYAVNGAGVGHLTRLIAISRWVRRYCAYLGIKAEIWFLTSSEADGLLFAENFAAFKLPSKGVVGEAGIDKIAYLALAKQWVWHSLGLLRPDLFVVDTFPRGAFGELLSALDLCARKAFIYRPVKAEFAGRADFQAMLPLYDSILIPEHEGVGAGPAPPSVADRVSFVGPVMVRERAEWRERGAVRAMLGIAEDALAVFVSAGGGGDPDAEGTLLRLIDLAQDSTLHLVIGPGPLYRGQRVFGPRITWLEGLPAAEILPALDVAVCAAGYNTFHEVLFAGLPAVFLPQPKIADEQDTRAERAVQAGAAVRLPPGTGVEAIRRELDRLRDPAVRQAASRAAQALVPDNCARVAAGELLRLLFPAEHVEMAEEVFDDEVLEALRDAPFDLASVCAVAQRLEGRKKNGPPLPFDGEDSSLMAAIRLLRSGRSERSEWSAQDERSEPSASGHQAADRALSGPLT